jgi:predicted nuclease of predicted toxin-antitoxin system
VKALLDEHLSPQLAAMLRRAGHDAVAVAERGDILGQRDKDVFEAACREGRAVVTNNIKDFRPLATEWLAQGRTHPGLILLPSSRKRTRAAVSGLARAIEVVLRDHPDGLDGGECWLDPL